jgi:hypothetical protein
MSFKKTQRDSHNIRILRLKTGEQLITRISSSNQEKLYLHRPMRINTVIMGDPSDHSGESRREIVFLNNWVEFAETDSIAIPKDIIFAILPPNKETVKAYELQQIKEDSWDKHMTSEMMSELADAASNGEMMTDEEVPNSSFEEVISDIVEKIISSHFGLHSDEISEEEWDENLVDKDREDYGNDLDDWSPYTDDYR